MDLERGQEVTKELGSCLIIASPQIPITFEVTDLQKEIQSVQNETQIPRSIERCHYAWYGDVERLVTC